MSSKSIKQQKKLNTRAFNALDVILKCFQNEHCETVVKLEKEKGIVNIDVSGVISITFSDIRFAELPDDVANMLADDGIKPVHSNVLFYLMLKYPVTVL